MFSHVHMAMNDVDGYPFIIPLVYAYEVEEDKLYIYVHFGKQGHKNELLEKDQRVCLEFSTVKSYGNDRYKGHAHDYRNIITKGKIKIIDYKEVCVKSEIDIHSIDDVPFGEL